MREKFYIRQDDCRLGALKKLYANFYSVIDE